MHEGQHAMTATTTVHPDPAIAAGPDVEGEPTRRAAGRNGRWALAGAACGGGAFWLVRRLYRWRTGRDGMGMGDVLLAGVLGLGLGPERLPMTVLLAALSALALAGLRAWRRSRPLHRLGRVPFGASLALAAVLMALFGEFVQFGTMP